MATVLDERPAPSPVPARTVPRRSAVPVSRWRLSARLARREVQRRPGRTLLVTLLVAIPVLGMTMASVLAHTMADPWAEDFALSRGRADMVVQVYGNPALGLPSSADTAPGVPTDEELDGALPAGSRWETYTDVYAPVRTAEETRNMWVTDTAIALPLLTGMVSVRDGRAPARSDEVAIDAGTADRFGVGVGDALTLVEPAGTWTVAGIVRFEARWSQPILVLAEFDWARVAPGNVGATVYIDLPADTSTDRIAAAVTSLQRFGSAEARDLPPEYLSTDEVPPSAMAWGWVAGALALCVVGIIIAAAFATSARRQLVTLGQLSANGADQSLLRRTMALQGSWSGLLGSVGGVVVGLVLLVVLRGVVEGFADKDLGGYEIQPLDLVIVVVTGVVAATVAALVPARSIAKVPVMAALAGRRPLSAVPRRLVPIGLGLFGGGLFLMLVAASSTADGSSATDLDALVAILGGLGVLFGMCCLTPLAVDTVGRVGARLSGSWKVSARSLARTRTRSAGVVTAIAAAGALALGGATAFASSMAGEPSPEVSGLPADTVLVTATVWDFSDMGVQPGGTYDPPGYQPAAIPASVLAQIDAVVDGTVTTSRVALWDPAPYRTTTDGIRVDGLVTDDSGYMFVADPDVLDFVGLSEDDRSRLDDKGAMVLQAFEPAVVLPDGSLGQFGQPEPILIQAEGEDLTFVDVITPLDPIDSVAGVWGTLVTPAKAAELGFEIVDGGVYIQADDDLTTEQIRRLQHIQQESWNGSVFDVPDAASRAGQTQVSITPSYVDEDVPEGLVNLAIAVAALVFTLAIVGVGLALSAAESRDERDVLVAIGAKPSTMRRVAGQKAALMALAGTLLAVPTGLLPVVTVTRAIREYEGDYPIDMPWLMLAVLVLGIPALAGVVTWAGSAVAQRVRPTRMSTLATD